jgi:hypothetical protein
VTGTFTFHYRILTGLFAKKAHGPKVMAKDLHAGGYAGSGVVQMKKIFAANWISAARAMAPASNTAMPMFHPLRPGIGAAGARLELTAAASARD